MARHGGIMLCATTGIAAINLGEGVTTINSLLGFFDTASLRDTWSQGFLSVKLMRLWRAGLRQIVLDEVSMMDAEQLTILSAAIDEINDRLGDSQERRLGLTLVGDFLQLPPIKAPFAFESDFWPRYEENTTILREFRRQTDPQFLQALQHARRGEGAAAVDYFSRYFQLSQDPNYPSTTLLSKNMEVDRFNLLRASKVQGDRVTFRASRWGKERAEWKQVPDELHLKTNTLVMILSNEKEYDPETGEAGEFIYVNGDTGILKEADPNCAHVELRRTGQVEPVTMVKRRNLEPLEPGKRKELRSQGKGHLIVCANLSCRDCKENPGTCRNAKYEIVGELVYMPLRLAYATTVHKSQGLTMDQVQVDFRDRFFDSPGMLYVALSRVRTPEGLRLVGRHDQFVRRCQTDPKVRRWL